MLLHRGRPAELGWVGNHINSDNLQNYVEAGAERGGPLDYLGGYLRARIRDDDFKCACVVDLQDRLKRSLVRRNRAALDSAPGCHFSHTI